MSEVPDDWSKTTLLDAAEVVMGQSPPGSSYNDVGEGKPFFQGKTEFGDRHPTIRKWTTSGNREARVGDILMSVRAPVGPTNIANVDCVIGRGLAAIRARDATDQTYLLWLIRSIEHEIASKGTGTTFDSITGGALKSTEVILPPLPEQERIVEILEEQFSRLESALASVKAVREKAHAFRRSLLHSAFSGELTGGTEGWREVALGEAAETQLGKMLNSKKQTGTAVMPYLRNINLRWGGFDLADVKEMDIFPNEVELFTLRNGDLLICEGGEPGRCAVWNRDGEMAFQNAIHRVRPHAELSPQFLALQFEAKVTNGELEHLFSGVTIKHFSQQKLRAVEVALPPLAEQERIVEILEEQFSRLDKALEVANQLESRIASERRSLLHSAFTGELTTKWRKTNV